MSDLKPLNNYVLLKIDIKEEKTSGGLYVPPSVDDATSILKKGTVIAVSKKVKDEFDLNTDDVVYYNKHAVTKIPDSDSLILVRVEDLYAVI